MKRLHDELLSYASRGEVPPPEVQQRAASERARLMASRSRKAVKSRGRRRDAAETKAERKEARAEVRAAAMERERGKCAVCGKPNSEWERLHLHHLAGRHNESLETVIMLCAFDHRMVHDGNIPVLKVIAAHCVGHGMKAGALAVGRRLAGIEDARRAPAGRATP